MDARFKVSASTLNAFLGGKTHPNSRFEAIRKDTVYPALDKFIVGNGEVLDGEALQEEVFPTDKFNFDIFLSHSHKDLELAKSFASYLESKGIKVFLDSYIWKSADGLLQKIDDRYCKDTDGKHYIYKRRNYSTSHVHAMLTMAIMEMIVKTQYSFFIESNNSIILKNLGNTSRAMTLSPWIYEELKIMKTLVAGSDILEKSFSATEAMSLEIAHPAGTEKGFKPINLSELYRLDKCVGREWLDNLNPSKAILYLHCHHTNHLY